MLRSPTFLKRRRSQREREEAADRCLGRQLFKKRRNQREGSEEAADQCFGRQL